MVNLCGKFNITYSYYFTVIKMKLNKNYKNRLKINSIFNGYDFNNSTEREEFYQANRKEFKKAKRTEIFYDFIKKAENFSIYTLAGVAVAVLAVGINGEIKLKQFYKQPQVQQIDSIYNSQRDSLHNDYLFKLNTIEENYQNKLDSLEEKLK